MKSYQDLLDRSTKNGECIEFKGCISKDGYGKILLNNKPMIASRASYFLNKGNIPKGLHVCHSCDNPSCINPNHLWLGTPKENRQDAMKKGRLPVGIKIHTAKLDSDKVKEIRRLYKEGIKQSSLSKTYSVVPHTISRIVHNKIWKEYAP